MNHPLSELAEIIRLAPGGHNSPQDGVCVNELTAWIAGEEHSARPKCASRTISSFLLGCNDQMSSPQRQRLAPYALRQIGTRGTKEQEQQRQFMCADWAVRVATPMALHADGRDWEAEQLKRLPKIYNSATSRDAAPIVAAIASRAYHPTANKAVLAASPPFSLSSAYTAAQAAACAAAVVTPSSAAWTSALELVDQMIAITGSVIGPEIQERAALVHARIAVAV